MISLRLILDWDMVMQRLGDEGQPGSSIDPETLPLSRKTCDALWTRYRRWSTLFLNSDDEGVTPLDRKVDWRLLEKEGLALWSKVRVELGSSYRVFYFSEILHQTFGTLEEYDRAVADGFP